MARAASGSRSSSALQWLGSSVAIGLTIIITVLVVRGAKERLDADPPAMLRVQSEPFKPGVLATISSGGVTVEREFPTLDFLLVRGESLDERLPAGAFEAEFTVRFKPGRVDAARIGALLRGGSVIIIRNGAVVHSNFVSDEEKAVLATVPESFSRAPQELTYIFKTDGKSPARLQAVWQPIGADQPQPLPMTAR